MVQNWVLCVSVGIYQVYVCRSTYFNLCVAKLSYFDNVLWFCFWAAEGLKYYDLVEGKGAVAEKGSTVEVGFVSTHVIHFWYEVCSSFLFTKSAIGIVFWHELSQVHFDCIYSKITVVSSRESKLLAGNRSIAQVINILSIYVDVFFTQDL